MSNREVTLTEAMAIIYNFIDCNGQSEEDRLLEEELNAQDDG